MQIVFVNWSLSTYSCLCLRIKSKLTTILSSLNISSILIPSSLCISSINVLNSCLRIKRISLDFALILYKGVLLIFAWLYSITFAIAAPFTRFYFIIEDPRGTKSLLLMWENCFLVFSLYYWYITSEALLSHVSL